MTITCSSKESNFTFPYILEDNEPDLSLDFIVPLKLVNHWNRCSLVANFFATYQSQVFKNKDKVISILSTITNELIENAVKFSCDQNKIVKLSLRYFNDLIYLETKNTAKKSDAKRIIHFFDTLETETPESLFIKKIEENAARPNKKSEIGLLSLIKDYQAKFAYQINEDDANDTATIQLKTLISQHSINAH
ncbi:MAG: hypothetical protein CL521_01210 [Actinobacteria bacterium]|nr:hypothetical protein [Actinomycetota bacterium]